MKRRNVSTDDHETEGNDVTVTYDATVTSLQEIGSGCQRHDRLLGRGRCKPGPWRPTLSQAHREAALIDGRRPHHARDWFAPLQGTTLMLTNRQSPGPNAGHSIIDWVSILFEVVASFALHTGVLIRHGCGSKEHSERLT
jgi:hypothetical protein